MDAIRLMKTPGSQCPESSEEIERLLSCPICLEVFSKPVVILPCQHNLCRKCAQDMFTSRGTPMGGGGRFRCPTCRYEVLLDRHGVYGLQRNLLVENIIDMYQTSQNIQPTITYKPVEEVVLCTDHPEEKVNIYCVTCQKPTCSLCKIFGSHADCEVATLAEMHTTLKMELSDSIAKLVTTNDQLEAAISQTEEIASVTEMNGNSVKSKVNSAFDKLKEILEARRQIMISIITKELKKKKEYAEKIKTGLKNNQTLSTEVMDGSLNLVQVKQSAVFLDQARDMINKIEDHLEVTYDNDTCMDLKDMSKFEINFSEEEEVMNLIHFLSMKGHNDMPTSSTDAPVRPWEIDNSDESEEEEEEEEEQAPVEEPEESADEDGEAVTETQPTNEPTASSETSDSDTDDANPYISVSSRRSGFPWSSRASGTSAPLTTASLRNIGRASSPENSRSTGGGEKKKKFWFEAGSDDDDSDTEAPATSSSTTTATAKPKSSLRVKIDPPKPFIYTKPSYKPKRPVRFANLLPLSDSDNDADNYSSSRRGRLAVTSRYGGPGASLGSDLPGNTNRTSVDSMLDPGTVTPTRSGSPSSSDELGADGRRKNYCTHKRRTWSHLLDRNGGQ